MDESIDAIKDYVIRAIDGHPVKEQAYIITELTDKLLAERDELLVLEYFFGDEE